MIRLVLDGATLEVAEGASILEAADAAGIYIPRLCSHPDLPSVAPELLDVSAEVHQAGTRRTNAGGEPPDGCGLCVVEIEGRDAPVRACTTPVEDGMRVRSATPAPVARRRTALERIFATHPHSCIQCAQRTGCSLEPCSTNVAKEERCCPIFHTCELRRVAEHVGIPNETPRYRPPSLPVARDAPLFLWDHNLCIGCLRCVRVCRDLRQVDALGFVLDEEGRPVVGTKAASFAASGCRFCLSCVEICPTGSLRLTFEEPRRDGERVAPCAAACPAGMDVPRYVREIARGEFARAEAVIREAAPLPRTLGQVCFHPCEEKCHRRDLAGAVSICALKRAALEHAEGPSGKAQLAPDSVSNLEPHLPSRLEPRLVSHQISRFGPLPDTGRKVAIVGAGPAGLAAAWFLRLKGHAVTLYDSQAAAGGWLRDGIPAYRLSRAALEADLQEILALGVTLRMEVEVGREIPLAEIRESHDAVLLALGARRPKTLACEGVELPGIESGLGFLRELARSSSGRAETTPGEGRSPAGPARDAPCDNYPTSPLPSGWLGETVVVIGGGNVAVDVARAAVRLGPVEVHLCCLEEREAMPAHHWEVEQAEREGVVIHPGWGPLRFSGDGRVERLELRRCLSVLDDRGRFAPRFDESDTFVQRADRVLLAIGQEPDLPFLDVLDGVSRSPAGTIEVDRESLRMNAGGLFAAGEIVLGPASVVQAIAQGRRAAASIDRQLGGDGDVGVHPLEEEVQASTLAQTDPPAASELGPAFAARAAAEALVAPGSGIGRAPSPPGGDFATLQRLAAPCLSSADARGSFALVESGYSAEDAMREAARCLGCDLRLRLQRNPSPPVPWWELTAEKIAEVPAAEGVYRLLDENKAVFAIKGVENLRETLCKVAGGATRAKYFLFDTDPMYTKRESELIQEYLREHGSLPPGEGEDELDGLF